MEGSKILLLIGFWLILAVLSIGIAGFHFVYMSRMAKKPWSLKLDKNYLPKVSIIIPTYNEAEIINFKLRNLVRVSYPKSLLQYIVVDSNSDDDTLQIAGDFAKQHPNLDFLILSLDEKGKSVALNLALRYAKGDVVVVSDADCFYPRDILRKALRHLSDPKVGAISGPKMLMNCGGSNVARTEERYLGLMNLVKLGESKLGFTTLFEGGFSAYKKQLLSSFDPYKTGSDDCGSIITLAEKDYSALFVPEAMFFTTFPTTWKERLRMKIRRANQLVRVFKKYLFLLLQRRIGATKRVILTNIFIYIFGPLFFALFLSVTIMVFIVYPYLAVILLVLFVPKVGSMLIEVIQSYLVLFFSLFMVALKKKFLVWSKPADRKLLSEEMLNRHDFI